MAWRRPSTSFLSPGKSAGTSASPCALTNMTFASVRHIVFQTLMGWYDDNAPRHGAAIAYYTLFALAPVLLVVITLAGLFFGQDAVRGELVGQLASLVGRDGALAIQAILQRASAPRDSATGTIVGVAGLLFATTGAFLELQAALNKIWRVAPAPGPVLDIKALTIRRVRSLGVVVAIGFLLTVSLTVSAAVGAAAAWWGDLAPGWPIALAIVNQTISIGVSAALFSVLFRVLPDVRLLWRDVAVGSVVTAVMFAIGQRLIGLYLGQSALASPFGAAGTVAIILVWVYYAAQIVLLGAVFTRVYSERRHRTPELLPETVRTSAASE